MLTLAVAIGIGRFAFTPDPAMMQKDAGLSLAAAGWLASANYLGYFIGAVSAIWIRTRSAAIILISLLAIALVTAAMGVTDNPRAWLVLRALAGIASAWALVFGSAWVLQRLATMGRHRLAGVVFGGVGLGAALAGGMCLVFLHLAWSSDRAWIAMGTAALFFTVMIWPGYAGAPVPTALGTATGAPMRSGAHMRLIWSYGCFGFGYIIPATFLPAMARNVISDPCDLRLGWPIFVRRHSSPHWRQAGSLAPDLSHSMDRRAFHPGVRRCRSGRLAWHRGHRAIRSLRRRHLHGCDHGRDAGGAPRRSRQRVEPDGGDDRGIRNRADSRSGTGEHCRRRSRGHGPT